MSPMLQPPLPFDLLGAASIPKRVAATAAGSDSTRFVSGERLPFLGRGIPLAIETDREIRTPQVHFEMKRFRVVLPPGLPADDRADRIRHAFVAWYRREADRRLNDSVERWYPRFDVATKPRVLIRDQRRRWGSCDRDGTLRLNWRNVMLEPGLFDYVVAHELAHLAVRNHSDAFWKHLTSVMPDARARRQRLADAGRRLPF
ncbi:MAG: M48 family metallopeptidase [Acidobacteria bacterium]|nr:M48 family metallopeptidase [Acidobacteriota bacterium]